MTPVKSRSATRRVASPASPAKPEEPAAELRGVIRAAGLRSTAPRVAVLGWLRRARAPLSHGEIAEALAPQGFDRATIYRNLVDLTDAGLLRRIDVGDHVWRFEREGDGGAAKSAKASHPHFVCVDCGALSCLPEVSVAISPKPGSQRSKIGDVSQVLLQGHCGQC